MKKLKPIFTATLLSATLAAYAENQFNIEQLSSTQKIIYQKCLKENSEIHCQQISDEEFNKYKEQAKKYLKKRLKALETKDVSFLKKECLNDKNLESCALSGMTLAERKQFKEAKKMLYLACPADGKNYDAGACGYIGLEMMPNGYETVVNGVSIDFKNSGNMLYKPDPSKAVFYFERACNSNISKAQQYCYAAQAARQYK